MGQLWALGLQKSSPMSSDHIQPCSRSDYYLCLMGAGARQLPFPGRQEKQSPEDWVPDPLAHKSAQDKWEKRADPREGRGFQVPVGHPGAAFCVGV